LIKTGGSDLEQELITHCVDVLTLKYISFMGAEKLYREPSSEHVRIRKQVIRLQLF